MGSEKVRENRLRRMADRQGFRLMKSRARDPRDITYGGYMLVDLVPGRNRGTNYGRGFQDSLDRIEEYLTAPEPEGAKR